jgi:DNA-binding SARP family transcriptional activator
MFNTERCAVSTICIFLFRDFSITCDEQPWPGLEGRKVRELLSYLLLNQERPHRREALTAMLWEEGNATVAQKYFRQVLWQLQSAFATRMSSHEEPILMADLEWVQINPRTPIWCDVTIFQQVIRAAQGTTGYQLSVAQAHDLQEAVNLYHGDLLEGWYQDWCLVEREHLQNMYLMTLDKLIDYCEAHRLFEDGIGYGMRVLKHEHARERLMRLYCLLGDRTGAIRQYEQCVAALRKEFDVAPSERTVQLYHHIRNDEPVIAPPPPLPTTSQQAADLTELLGHLMQLQAHFDEAHHSLRRDIEIVSGIMVASDNDPRAVGPFLPPD